MIWIDLIGKRIAAFRGFPKVKFGKPHTEVDFILFDDGKTFIRLRGQDSYDYHDCNPEAKTLDILEDAKLWQKMFDKDGYAEPDVYP